MPPKSKKPIRDRRAWFADLQARTPRAPAELKRQFVQRRLRPKGDPRSAVPGGVGYGIFYMQPTDEDGTRIRTWERGTGFAMDVVAPSPPGGNLTTYLYLTATNRSSLGVEALISYYAQTNLHFMVYDWSAIFDGADPLSDHPWVVDIPLAALATDYLHSAVAHGVTYPTVLSLFHVTYMVELPDQWANQVFLNNNTSGEVDLIYERLYTSDRAAHDHDQDVSAGFSGGSWAGIVETFQDTYVGTHPMGMLAMQSNQAPDSGDWDGWLPLPPLEDGMTYVTGNDDAGFTLDFLDETTAFVVHS